MTSIDPNQIANADLPTHIEEMVETLTSSERLRTHEATYAAFVEIGRQHSLSSVPDLDWLVMPILSKCYAQGWLNSERLADVIGLFGALGVQKGHAFNRLLGITEDFFDDEGIDPEPLTALYRSFDRIPLTAATMTADDIRCMLQMISSYGDDYYQSLARQYLMPAIVTLAPTMTAAQASTIVDLLIEFQPISQDVMTAYHALCRRIPEVVDQMTTSEMDYCIHALVTFNYRLPDERSAAHALMGRLPSVISELDAAQIRLVTKMMHHYNVRNQELLGVLGQRIIEVAGQMGHEDIYWHLWAINVFKIEADEVVKALARHIPAIVGQLTNERTAKLIAVLTELNRSSVEVRDALGYLRWGIMYCPPDADGASSSS